MANRHTKQLCVCTPGRFFFGSFLQLYTGWQFGKLRWKSARVRHAIQFDFLVIFVVVAFGMVCRSCHRIVLRLTISTVLLWVSTSLQWIWCVCSVFSVSSLRVFLGFYRCHWHYSHSNFIYAKFIDLSCVYW